MTIIKSYTDIEQSRKLAEILPLESADMWWSWYSNPFDGVNSGKYDNEPLLHTPICNPEKTIPCWSLAALLNLLPNEISTDNSHYQIHIRKYDGGDSTTLYQIAYGNNRGSSGSWHDMINTGEKENFIDCCVQMILELKEENLL